jgi:FlaA1/EpsC-like NDP-sugar epimerase
LKQILKKFHLNKRVSLPHLLVDLFIIIASTFASLYLRLRSDEYYDHLSALLMYLPLIVLVRFACLYFLNCYSVIWRYISANDAFQIMKACFASSVLIVLITFFIPDQFERLPRTFYVIDGILVSLGLLGARLLRRLQIEQRGVTSNAQLGKRTLIYGAGQNGRLLAQRFKVDASLNTQVIGFIDDDHEKRSMTIQGVPVLGLKADLANVIEANDITQIIIALGHLPSDLLRDIVQITRKYNIRPRVVTSLAQSKNMEVYRDIDLSDLLGRSRREMDLTSVKEMIKGRKILVTGAGGSIGSELARQIMSHEPARLLLLDHSEFSLYEIDKELRLTSHESEKVVPLLIDLKDEKTLRLALREYVPDVVFHAAAYKHVHLVETNPYSSIINNVQATKTFLQICKEINVENFVLISSDKAVNPVGVMGATKRVCELLVAMSALETKKLYCSVRFGNVLGSSGSLIPLLKNQIIEGGPITITHQDMTRFFMLIPEAVSLVLKAATISNPGDISVLRMGEPVKIVEVARSLMALMGKTEEEIPIIYTGLRPGEKMFEELYIRGDELITEHPDILTLPNGDSTLVSQPESVKRLSERISKMCDEAYSGSKQALFELNEIVKTSSLPSTKKESSAAARTEH